MTADRKAAVDPRILLVGAASILSLTMGSGSIVGCGAANGGALGERGRSYLPGSAVKTNFSPEMSAANMRPPLATVNTAMPLW